MISLSPYGLTRASRSESRIKGLSAGPYQRPDHLAERRERHRYLNLTLTEPERARVRVSERRREFCRHSWIELRRVSASPSGRTEHRRLMPIPCGLRGCERCAERRRRDNSLRAQGPWKVTVTLTLPRDRPLREQWESMPRWVSRYCAALRGAARRDREEFQLDGGKLDYAWALEAQKDGTPHAHLVFSAGWIPASWSIETWNRITGCVMAWQRIEQIRDRSDMCRYLCKYIVKAGLSDDVLAILYRRRLFASTMPASSSGTLGWEVVGPIGEVEASSQCDDPEGWARWSGGWRVAWSGPGGAEWTRDVPKEAESS